MAEDNQRLQSEIRSSGQAQVGAQRDTQVELQGLRKDLLRSNSEMMRALGNDSSSQMDVFDRITARQNEQAEKAFREQQSRLGFFDLLNQLYQSEQQGIIASKDEQIASASSQIAAQQEQLTASQNKIANALAVQAKIQQTMVQQFADMGLQFLEIRTRLSDIRALTIRIVELMVHGSKDDDKFSDVVGQQIIKGSLISADIAREKFGGIENLDKYKEEIQSFKNVTEVMDSVFNKLIKSKIFSDDTKTAMETVDELLGNNTKNSEKEIESQKETTKQIKKNSEQDKKHHKETQESFETLGDQVGKTDLTIPAGFWKKFSASAAAIFASPAFLTALSGALLLAVDFFGRTSRQTAVEEMKDQVKNEKQVTENIAQLTSNDQFLGEFRGNVKKGDLLENKVASELIKLNPEKYKGNEFQAIEDARNLIAGDTGGDYTSEFAGTIIEKSDLVERIKKEIEQSVIPKQINELQKAIDQETTDFLKRQFSDDDYMGVEGPSVYDIAEQKHQMKIKELTEQIKQKAEEYGNLLRDITPTNGTTDGQKVNDASKAINDSATPVIIDSSNGGSSVNSTTINNNTNVGFKPNPNNNSSHGSPKYGRHPVMQGY